MNKKQETIFEYCSIHNWDSQDRFIQEMNRLGKKGWELVSVTPDTYNENSVAFFKRQIQ